MTTRERMLRMFDRKEADRVPIIDHPWPSTIARWKREGLPEDMAWEDYLGTDKHISLMADISPRYPEKTIEETEEYRIYTTKYGVTMKQWKHAASTPQYFDYTVKDADTWRKAKERMVPSDDRIDWEWLKTHYKRCREEGQWIQAYLWFGFDATQSGMVGTEETLMAIAEDPEWIMDTFDHMLTTALTLTDRMWDAGYTVDSIMWTDDLGYKDRTFFSLDTYRQILKPYHQRAIDWAHKKGIKTILHSCGNINSYIPDLIDMGLECFNPIEVKAGMNPEQMKKDYGDKLVLHGGLNALLYENETKEPFFEEIKRLVPIMKENGGYIFGTDHSVPDSVSLEDYRQVVKLAKDYGSF